MAEKPFSLNIDLTQVKWQHSEPRLDVTTGAPQKLYRYLLDAIQTRGYHVIQGKEPDITGTAFEKTGTTHGEILAEKMVKTMSSPWYLVGTYFGVIIILYGLYILFFTGGLVTSFTGSLVISDENIIMGIVILIVGSIIAGVTETFFKTKFESRLLYTTLKGEVYYSTLGENVSGGQLNTESRRASMISDLRLGINLTTIFSRNYPSNVPGGIRWVLQYIYTEGAEEDFNGILTDINTSILPKLMLKKQEEAVAKPSAGASLKELNDRLDQINEIFNKLDESLAQGEINEAKYKELTEKYRAEADSLKDQIAKKKFM